ncbi:MAG: hypothetical protein ABI606_05440 [Rhodoferax sp.]
MKLLKYLGIFSGRLYGRQRYATGCVLDCLTGAVKALPGNFFTAAGAFD